MTYEPCSAHRVPVQMNDFCIDLISKKTSVYTKHMYIAIVLKVLHKIKTAKC